MKNNNIESSILKNGGIDSSCHFIHRSVGLLSSGVAYASSKQASVGEMFLSSNPAKSTLFIIILIVFFSRHRVVALTTGKNP